MRVIGKRETAGPQVGNHRPGMNRVVRVALLLAPAGRDRAAQEDGQGREAGQDLSFARP